jgi:hypothetical protein
MPRVKKNTKAVVPKEVEEEEEEDEVELLKGKIANNIPDRGSQLTRHERDNYLLIYHNYFCSVTV